MRPFLLAALVGGCLVPVGAGLGDEGGSALFEVETPFWALVVVEAAAPSDLWFNATWILKDSMGGYDAYGLWHWVDNGARGYDIASTQYTCNGNVTATGPVSASWTTDCGFGGQVQSSKRIPLLWAGRHTFLVARAGDIFESATLAVHPGAGVSVLSAETGSSTHFYPIERPPEGTAVGVTAFSEVRAAFNASASVDVHDTLTGVFWWVGTQEVADLEVEGPEEVEPEHYESATFYHFERNAPGSWTFRWPRLVGFGSGMVFVVDAPVPEPAH